MSDNDEKFNVPPTGPPTGPPNVYADAWIKRLKSALEVGRIIREFKDELDAELANKEDY